MNEFKLGNNKEEKIEKFLDQGASYFYHQNYKPTGVFHTIGKISTHLEKLNENLIEANKSSERLTRALNSITFWGVIVAGVGVTVAALNLGFDIYQYVVIK